MTRSVTSLLVLVALFGVMMLNVCVACSGVPMTMQAAHECCQKSKCHMPSGGSHKSTCSTPAAADLARIDQVLDKIAGDAVIVVDDRIVERAAIAPPLSRPAVPVRARQLATPDLCLLHSVLTV